MASKCVLLLALGVLSTTVSYVYCSPKSHSKISQIILTPGHPKSCEPYGCKNGFKCINDKCKCPDGYIIYKDHCYKLRNLYESCEVTAQCNTDDSECIHKKCVCKDSYAPSRLVPDACVPGEVQVIIEWYYLNVSLPLTAQKRQEYLDDVNAIMTIASANIDGFISVESIDLEEYFPDLLHVTVVINVRNPAAEQKANNRRKRSTDTDDNFVNLERTKRDGHKIEKRQITDVMQQLIDQVRRALFIATQGMNGIGGMLVKIASKLGGACSSNDHCQGATLICSDAGKCENNEAGADDAGPECVDLKGVCVSTADCDNDYVIRARNPLCEAGAVCCMDCEKNGGLCMRPESCDEKFRVKMHCRDDRNVCCKICEKNPECVCKYPFDLGGSDCIEKPAKCADEEQKCCFKGREEEEGQTEGK